MVSNIAFLLFGRCILRAQHKIVGLPARSDGQRSATIGDVVDHSPLFGNAGRVVQGAYATACAHADVFRDGGHGSARDRGVGVGAAKGVEVALGRPHCAETVLICELGTFQQQFVFLGAGAVVVAPVVEAEVHLLIRDRKMAAGDERAVLVAGEHQFEAARQGVEQLQHRNVERQAGDGQPHTGWIVADAVVHAAEEVRHIAVLDHHALGSAGGARGVDHVGDVGRLHAAVNVGVGLGGDLVVLVDHQHLRLVRGRPVNRADCVTITGAPLSSM